MIDQDKPEVLSSKLDKIHVTKIVEIPGVKTTTVREKKSATVDERGHWLPPVCGSGGRVVAGQVAKPVFALQFFLFLAIDERLRLE